MKKKTKESGSTLILTMIVMLVAFTLAVSLLLAAQTSSHMSARRTTGELAFRIAEAGIQQAAMSLKENGAYNGEQNTAFGAGNFSVVLTTPAGQPNQRLVSSTGIVKYAEGMSASRSLSALVDLYTPPPIGNFGMFSQNALNLNGNVTIDSTPNVSQANVGSNTSVSVIGHVTVNGGATSAGSVSVVGAARVTGAIHANAPVVPFPQLNFVALKNQATANGVTNGNVTVSGPAPYVLTGLINGNLTLSGSGHVTIQSPVFVTGTISFGGSGPVDGGTLISASDITAAGQNTLTGNGTLALVTQGNFSLAGGSSVTAAVYVPNGTFSVHGNAKVTGTVVANTITIAGTPTFLMNTSFTWPKEFAPTRLGFYQE